MGQEKFGKLKFCLVQNVFENCGQNMFVQGIIQFTSRLSEKKARLYFLEKGVNPEGIKMYMASSPGSGFKDYKRILDESFNAYYDLRAKRILEKPIFKNKITNTIFNLLLIKRV